MTPIACSASSRRRARTKVATRSAQARLGMPYPRTLISSRTFSSAVRSWERNGWAAL
uniref:Uncharacterized protein n=1 Tax=Arundo donax TaxID=35708 RepID=A0A0A9FUL7_ARUDO